MLLKLVHLLHFPPIWRVSDATIFRTLLTVPHPASPDLTHSFMKGLTHIFTLHFFSSYKCANRNVLQKQQQQKLSRLLHCNGNSVYIYLFWALRGLSPNFHIHVSMSDLYIPRIGPHISSSRKGRPIVGIYNSITDTWMWNWDWSPAIPFLGIFFSNFRHFVFAVWRSPFDRLCLFRSHVRARQLWCAACARERITTCRGRLLPPGSRPSLPPGFRWAMELVNRVIEPGGYKEMLSIFADQ
jgi:hypothetical protein